MNTDVPRTYIDWANVKDDMPRSFYKRTYDLSWRYSCMSAHSVSQTFLGDNMFSFLKEQDYKDYL